MSLEKLTICIDPGKHGCGLSMFSGPTLAHAEYISGRVGPGHHPLLEPVHGVEAFFEGAAMLGTIDLVIVERPKIYDAAHQKGDQRDIADLLIVAGGLLLAAGRVAKAVMPIEPAQWKGQTPTEIIEHRLEKHLSAEERGRIEWPTARKTLAHNVVDAIGIGMWHAGRIGK